MKNESKKEWKKNEEKKKTKTSVALAQHYVKPSEDSDHCPNVRSCTLNILKEKLKKVTYNGKTHLHFSKSLPSSRLSFPYLARTAQATSIPHSKHSAKSIHLLTNSCVGKTKSNTKSASRRNWTCLYNINYRAGSNTGLKSR